jgi:hypothetical protein
MTLWKESQSSLSWVVRARFSATSRWESNAGAAVTPPVAGGLDPAMSGGARLSGAARHGRWGELGDELEVELADLGAVETVPRPGRPRTVYVHAVLAVHVHVLARLARGVAELLEGQRGLRIAVPVDEPATGGSSRCPQLDPCTHAGLGPASL